MRIGYFGVILPYYEFWQGYFLDDSAKDDAEGFIKQIRSNFDNIYMPPSAVIRPIEYISEKDQSLIGAVSSVVVDFAAKQDNERIGTASMALHFYIIASIDAKGTTTKIVNLPDVKSDSNAREIIDSLPAVQTIKKTLSFFGS
jgi:hypothetical protein